MKDISKQRPGELAETRKRLGITQEALAAKLLVNQPTLSRWENSRRPASARDLRAWRTQLKRMAARRVHGKVVA